MSHLRERAVLHCGGLQGSCVCFSFVMFRGERVEMLSTKFREGEKEARLNLEMALLAANES